MVNLLEHSPVFVNPWDPHQNYPTTPSSTTPTAASSFTATTTSSSSSSININLDEDILKYTLPYRRHSSAQEQPTRNDTQRNWSTSFTSNSDIFGSIWNSNNSVNQFVHTNMTTPSFYSSSSNTATNTVSSASPLLPSSLTRSFPPTHDALPRPFRRFSLAPITHETTQDQVNALSSVPEESYLSHRRHSVAGPLVSSVSPSSSLLLPSHHNEYQHLSASGYYHSLNNHLSHAGINGNPSSSSSPSCNNMLTRMEEETKLLPYQLLASIEGRKQEQSSISWCMVEFKAGRAEIYYSSCPVDQDDWVIVEADRGRDLGKVVAKNLPLDQVQLLLAATSNLPTTTMATPTTATATATGPAASAASINYSPISCSSSATTSSSSDQFPSPSASSSSSSSSSSSCSSLPLPKQVCRLATSSEITLLVTKRHDEQKALLICQTKSKQKNLLMDIVDAEYQWDRRKLTFYFIAEKRVDFRELVRDLFKIYKTRIWMCSVNSMGKKNMASSN